ncbi:hypothetical protein [Desulfosporosinus sp. Sb-LF]|uniref:hypothetical protein n=1 Tax=Desulfosporosinus sp. Sb-LF TaxID=2560027 RepID=UPI00107F3863|nr:hypothetical protein [Desulfosporosinus sp. Sb-LF]TGE32395.1 hypothetical protein E4K68_12415 [Desulfosporosinus sp. Sb-LF]
MIMETFIVYFILFIVTFSYPGFRNKEKPNTLLKLLAVPALLGVIMVLLTVIKVYFVYKFLVLLFILGTFLLSYWQLGDQIRRWWK